MTYADDNEDNDDNDDNGDNGDNGDIGVNDENDDNGTSGQETHLVNGDRINRSYIHQSITLSRGWSFLSLDVLASPHTYRCQSVSQ